MRPRDFATPLTVGLVLGGAVLLAALNLLTAPGHPLHVPTYAVSLAGKSAIVRNSPIRPA